MRYLLDTDIVSDLVRNARNSPVAARIAEVGENRVCTSIIVTAELRYGAARKASPRLIKQVETVIAALDVLPFEPPSDKLYGELRARLETEGRLIGPNDLLIAAQTLALGHTLVTGNGKEFSRVAGLTVENWLR